MNVATQDAEELEQVAGVHLLQPLGKDGRVEGFCSAQTV